MSRFKPNSFYIYVRPCPRRSLDATRLYSYFVDNGLKPAKSPENSDLIVIYTCGGFTDTEEKSIITIENSLKTTAKVIITGCLPKINPKRIAIYNKAEVVFVDSLDQMDTIIGAKTPYKSTSSPSVVFGVHDLLRGNFYQRLKRNFEFSGDFIELAWSFLSNKLMKGSPDLANVNSPYRIEIGRGCLGNCTYCAIKKAMAKYSSTPEEQILRRFNSGLQEGYSNFVLISGDIGCYGVDTGSSLPILLKKLFAVEGNYQFELMDFSPRWLIKFYKPLLSTLKANPNRISKIIVPVQSGSDKILRLMKRDYEIADVKKHLCDLRMNLPQISLETHIIVGFPGETSEDFQKSVDLLQEVDFKTVQVYLYEDRPGTIASKLPNKVSNRIINKRAKILQELIAKKEN